MPTTARIARLFETFAALDVPLVARALNLPPRVVAANLAGLAQRQRAVRVRARLARRPLVRVQFEAVA